MKFIHLGDLHIGKRVNDFLMIKDQEYILNKIIEIALNQSVDAVLIAGDVYDKAVPAAEAVTLFDEFITKLADNNIKVYIISGNHDSAERLAYAGNLVRKNGIYISPVFDGTVTKEVFEDEYGVVNVYMLPFIKPIQVKRYCVGEDDSVELASKDGVSQDDTLEITSKDGVSQDDTLEITSKEDVLKDDTLEDNVYVDDIDGQLTLNLSEVDEEVKIVSYDDAYKVVMKQVQLDTSQRNIILAHQFVTGATTCDSEELAIGGMDNISIDNFKGFDYVALGHIHSPQKIVKDTIRYSGTPLKYSLSEMKHHKSVTLVEMKDKKNTVEGEGQKGIPDYINIEQIPLTPLHEMRHVKGTYSEITLRDNYKDTDTNDYIYITLTDEEDIPDAISRLRSIYPNIMKLDYDNTRTRKDMSVEVTEKVEEKKPIELFAELYTMQNNQSMTQEQEEYMAKMIESVWEG